MTVASWRAEPDRLQRRDEGDDDDQQQRRRQHRAGDPRLAPPLVRAAAGARARCASRSPVRTIAGSAAIAQRSSSRLDDDALVGREHQHAAADLLADALARDRRQQQRAPLSQRQLAPLAGQVERDEHPLQARDPLVDEAAAVGAAQHDRAGAQRVAVLTQRDQAR